MSWLERISVRNVEQENDPRSLEEQMGPGLTGQFDDELREKSSLHRPPIPPEFMGVEGEYDQSGLAKRVAIALDHDQTLSDVESLEIIQVNRAIILQGEAPDEFTLNRIVEVASAVDGTDVVDTSQVTVAAAR